MDIEDVTRGEFLTINKEQLLKAFPRPRYTPKHTQEQIMHEEGKQAVIEWLLAVSRKRLPYA